MGETYGGNLWGKPMGETYGGNLWGKPPPTRFYVGIDEVF